MRINHLSAYPTEAEVLIPAGTRFRVKQSITTGDLTVIALEETESGLSLAIDDPAVAAAAAVDGGLSPASSPVRKPTTLLCFPNFLVCLS